MKKMMPELMCFFIGLVWACGADINSGFMSCISISFGLLGWGICLNKN